MPPSEERVCKIVDEARAAYRAGWDANTDLARDSPEFQALRRKLALLRPQRDRAIHAALGGEQPHFAGWIAMVENADVAGTMVIPHGGIPGIDLFLDIHCASRVNLEATLAISSRWRDLIGTLKKGDYVAINGALAGSLRVLGRDSVGEGFALDNPMFDFVLTDIRKVEIRP